MRSSANFLMDKNSSRSSAYLCVGSYSFWLSPLLWMTVRVFLRILPDWNLPDGNKLSPSPRPMCSLIPPLPIFSLSTDYDILFAGWLSPRRGAVIRRSGSFSRYDLVGAAGGAKHCLQNTTQCCSDRKLLSPSQLRRRRTRNFPGRLWQPGPAGQPEG